MGGSLGLGKPELMHMMQGYRFVVRSGGEDENMRTSDGIFRQVFTIAESKTLSRRGRSG